jgi:LmbE family N-acetylglucosaminyl deacetylase
MTDELRMIAILAHPDDESLGVGGTLARYAAEGVHTSLITATRGERGRYFSNDDRPDDREVGRVREQELRAAAAELGVRELILLDYQDGRLDLAEQTRAIAVIAGHIRRLRPHVVITFDPFGAYGHPDHIAICQLATAATVAAASADSGEGGAPHAVAKLYYFVMDDERWAAYQAAFRTLGTTVNGVERRAVGWPGWSISATIDTRNQWETVWRAVCCHRTQLAIYDALGDLEPEHHRALWGSQTFYRVFSRVHVGREHETDLFTGLR